MSDNKGSFDFNDSFGNSRSYDDPATGKRVNARKGGPTPEQFWNDPKYARAGSVRTNSAGGANGLRWLKRAF